MKVITPQFLVAFLLVLACLGYTDPRITEYNSATSRLLSLSMEREMKHAMGADTSELDIKIKQLEIKVKEELEPAHKACIEEQVEQQKEDAKWLASFFDSVED